MPSWYYVPEPIFGSYSGWKQLSLPLWMLALMSLAPAILFARWSRQLQPGYCRKCGYDLTGNASGVCPECGRAITIDSSNPQAKSSED
jgi:predicted amidophosphoribosyltransferase